MATDPLQDLADILREPTPNVVIPGDPNKVISVRQNNPGNLKFVGQPEALGVGTKDFAIFPTADAGFEALKGQIDTDKGRGLTLSQFANKYAPSYENDTESWIRDVAKLSGIKPDTPISKIPTKRLAQAVMKVESGATQDPNDPLMQLNEIVSPRVDTAATQPTDPLSELNAIAGPGSQPTVFAGQRTGEKDVAGGKDWTPKPTGAVYPAGHPMAGLPIPPEELRQGGVIEQAKQQYPILKDLVGTYSDKPLKYK